MKTYITYRPLTNDFYAWETGPEIGWEHRTLEKSPTLPKLIKHHPTAAVGPSAREQWSLMQLAAKRGR